jgi:L-amino acid N-acyltransferase YncA
MIEALSLVVPPEYQRHVPPGGKGRLTTRLVQALADHARTEGAERVIYVVQPSNAASCIFFSAMGCEFAKGTYAGDPVYVYTHDLLEAAG